MQEHREWVMYRAEVLDRQLLEVMAARRACWGKHRNRMVLDAVFRGWSEVLHTSLRYDSDLLMAALERHELWAIRMTRGAVESLRFRGFAAALRFAWAAWLCALAWGRDSRRAVRRGLSIAQRRSAALVRSAWFAWLVLCSEEMLWRSTQRCAEALGRRRGLRLLAPALRAWRASAAADSTRQLLLARLVRCLEAAAVRSAWGGLIRGLRRLELECGRAGLATQAAALRQSRREQGTHSLALALAASASRRQARAWHALVIQMHDARATVHRLSSTRRMQLQRLRGAVRESLQTGFMLLRIAWAVWFAEVSVAAQHGLKVQRAMRAGLRSLWAAWQAAVACRHRHLHLEECCHALTQRQHGDLARAVWHSWHQRCAGLRSPRLLRLLRAGDRLQSSWAAAACCVAWRAVVAGRVRRTAALAQRMRRRELREAWFCYRTAVLREQQGAWSSEAGRVRRAAESQVAAVLDKAAHALRCLLLQAIFSAWRQGVQRTWRLRRADKAALHVRRCHEQAAAALALAALLRWRGLAGGKRSEQRLAEALGLAAEHEEALVQAAARASLVESRADELLTLAMEQHRDRTMVACCWSTWAACQRRRQNFRRAEACLGWRAAELLTDPLLLVWTAWLRVRDATKAEAAAAPAAAAAAAKPSAGAHEAALLDAAEQSAEIAWRAGLVLSLATETRRSLQTLHRCWAVWAASPRSRRSRRQVHACLAALGRQQDAAACVAIWEAWRRCHRHAKTLHVAAVLTGMLCRGEAASVLLGVFWNAWRQSCFDRDEARTVPSKGPASRTSPGTRALGWAWVAWRRWEADAKAMRRTDELSAWLCRGRRQSGELLQLQLAAWRMLAHFGHLARQAVRMHEITLVSAAEQASEVARRAEALAELAEAGWHEGSPLLLPEPGWLEGSPPVARCLEPFFTAVATEDALQTVDTNAAFAIAAVDFVAATVGTAVAVADDEAPALRPGSSARGAVAVDVLGAAGDTSVPSLRAEVGRGGATAFAAVASASAADLALPSERAAFVRTAAASQRPAVVRQEMVRGIAAAGIAVCLEPPAMADGDAKRLTPTSWFSSSPSSASATEASGTALAAPAAAGAAAESGGGRRAPGGSGARSGGWLSSSPSSASALASGAAAAAQLPDAATAPGSFRTPGLGAPAAGPGSRSFLGDLMSSSSGASPAAPREAATPPLRAAGAAPAAATAAGSRSAGASLADALFPSSGSSASPSEKEEAAPPDATAAAAASAGSGASRRPLAARAAEEQRAAAVSLRQGTWSSPGSSSESEAAAEAVWKQPPATTAPPPHAATALAVPSRSPAAPSPCRAAAALAAAAAAEAEALRPRGQRAPKWRWAELAVLPRS